MRAVLTENPRICVTVLCEFFDTPFVGGSHIICWAGCTTGDARYRAVQRRRRINNMPLTRSATYEDDTDDVDTTSLAIFFSLTTNIVKLVTVNGLELLGFDLSDHLDLELIKKACSTTVHRSFYAARVSFCLRREDLPRTRSRTREAVEGSCRGGDNAVRRFVSPPHAGKDSYFCVTQRPYYLDVFHTR